VAAIPLHSTPAFRRPALLAPPGGRTRLTPLRLLSAWSLVRASCVACLKVA